MHAVANRVEIPIESLERILAARAVPDFTGTVEILIRVLPTAGHEVEFQTEAVRDVPADNRTVEKENPVVTNDRVSRVRHALLQNAAAFTIGTKLKGIKASFLKGELRSFRILEVE